MGDPRKLKKKHETPRKVLDAERISTESALKREYGLRNTRELWVALKELKKVRREARRLLSMGEKGKEESTQVLSKLSRLGVITNPEATVEDILTLGVRDFLERRLQTKVVRRSLARTMRQSRQLITHGFICINGRKVTVPSYTVSVNDEPTVSYYKAIDVSVPVEEPKRKAQAPKEEPSAAPAPSAAA
ncbi:30S ribosomal protein S4 [Candidatus Micrarchaeota archaeon]|nr:30S ribosomal protein S4 [Candidatus Micrarchaeota archaeon]